MPRPRPILQYQLKSCKFKDHLVQPDHEAQQAKTGNPARQEREDRMDQQFKGLLGLLERLAPLVLLGLLGVAAVRVAQAMQAFQESTESKGPRGNPAPRAVRDRWEPQVSREPLVSQEYPALPGYQGYQDPLANPAWRGSPVRPENRERRGPWDRWDL